MIGNFVKGTSWGLRFILIALATFFTTNAPAQDFYSEDFESTEFTLGSPIGVHPDWYDGGGGPAVTAGNGVSGSTGLAAGSNIFTWVAHPFDWNAPHFQGINVQMDFQTDDSALFDDDRIGWMITDSSASSSDIFGIQMDPGGSGYNIEGYWDGVSVPDKRPSIVDLPALSANTWYRFRAEIAKLTATSASIDVTLTELDASGDPAGVVASGSVADTSALGADAPNTKYFTAATMWPAYKNYTSAAAPADNAGVSFLPVIFGAIGDYGANSQAEQDVADLINDSFLPDVDVIDFIVTTGDNSYGSASPTPPAVSTIDQNIGKYFSDYIGAYAGVFGGGSVENRFFPSIGNHDYSDGGGIDAYLDYFTLPGAGIPTSDTSGNERYYDFIRGPVHFFAINSDGSEPDGNSSTSVQAQWLEDQLAASTSPWKIVLMHHPAYSSSSNHGSSAWMQWLYEDWGATAVFAGHDHVYERIIRDDNGDGIDFAYFTTGAGGRSLYNFPGSGFVPGSEVRCGSGGASNGTVSNCYGSMIVYATSTSITFEYWSVEGSGTLVDTYTIGSPPPGGDDSDGDGVPDDGDACPGTTSGEPVDDDGCSLAQGGDLDNDGMADQDEIFYFGDTSRDGTGDYDGDGESDLDEILNGTDPTLPPLPILEGDNWRYFPGTAEPPTGWNSIGFDDSSWQEGPSGFGYGDGDDNTSPAGMQGSYLSVYARKEFTVADASAVSGLELSMDYDDGFVAYLNGTEVARNLVAGSPPAYNTAADANHEASRGGSGASPVEYFTVDPALLVTGTNVLTVQGHNVTAGSSDFSLIPALEEVIPPPENWIAYNDLNGVDGDNNASNVTRYDYTAASALLKDYNTGAPLAVTITGITVNGYDPKTGNGGQANIGTDAADAFGPPGSVVVDLVRGIELDQPNWENIIEFNNLDPTKEYIITLTANRNNDDYTGRWTRVTIEGADSFTNASSAGVSVSDPGNFSSQASVSFNTGYNTVNGYVAKWTGVTTGPDGSFSIKSEREDGFGASGVDKGYAMTAFKLEQVATGADADGDGVPDGTDTCPGTASGEEVDANGCSVAQGGDLDDDGMADQDEIAYFGNTNRDGSGDFDGDGESDIDEVLNGTDPTLPPYGFAFTAFNDCVYDAGTNAYIGANVTEYGIGNGFPGTGSSFGDLLDQATGNNTGVTATLAQSGGVTWQPDPNSGGDDTAAGTDALHTFGGITDMTGVIYYGDANWYVDLTFTGLDPTKRYNFVTSASRGNSAYTNRGTIYTISSVDTATNDSSAGTVEYMGDPLTVYFNTGDNYNEGYVARWTGIAPGADGSFTVRATHHPSAEDGRKAYAFDVFMLQEVESGPPSLLPGDVIISGFQSWNNPGADDPGEFIELFNTTDQPISLQGMELISRVDNNSDGALQIDWQLSADLTGKTIQPHSFFLIAESDVDVGTGVRDIATSLDLATGEGGLDERAIGLELIIDGEHMDHVLYGRHDGSDTGANPDGDIFFDGSSFPRDEVIRNTQGSGSFLEGLVRRESPEALYAGYDVLGFYTDEDLLGAGNPNGVWTSPHNEEDDSYEARNSQSPNVLPPGGPICYLLSLAHTGQGTNPVASPTNSTDCSAGEYVEGEPIQLNGAAADPGWQIAGWTGTDDNGSTAATNMVTMPASAHLVDVTYVPISAIENWTAYNDLAAYSDSTPTGNFTFTTTDVGGNTGLPHSSQLVDFDTGASTGVTLTVSGGQFNGSSHVDTQTGSPNGDAAAVFSNISGLDVGANFDATGTISYGGPPGPDIVLSFTGLDPTKAYTLVTFSHRDDYTDRIGLHTLSDVDDFFNESSAGTVPNISTASIDALFDGSTDSSTMLPSDNDAGWIAKFTNIKPGSNGEMILTVSDAGTDYNGATDRGRYINAVMLQEQTASFQPDIDHVVIISIDGLSPDALTDIDPSTIPNLLQLAQGSSTLNARTVYSHTNTLPNHTSMLTGRPVYGAGGHQYDDNGEPGSATLHSNHPIEAYVYGVFDVAYDNGLGTALFASKTKFSLFTQSWPDKIDLSRIDTGDLEGLYDDAISELQSAAASSSLIFLHDRRPDSAGHSGGWDTSPPSEPYVLSILDVDASLGRLMEAIRSNPDLNGRTAIILTSDHGGEGTGHGDVTDPDVYTIPFLVWLGDGYPTNDLYAFNPTSRTDPGTGRPLDAQAAPAPEQPVRNADMGNLALDLLGLPPIPNSVVDAAFDLEVLAGMSTVEYCENFESFTLNAPIHQNSEWFTESIRTDPVPQSGIGVNGSVGLTEGVPIFTWTAHPFKWSETPAGDAVMMKIDFKTDSSGLLDDDRAGWTVSNTDDSSNHIFGVQIDPEGTSNQDLRLEGYWDGDTVGDDDGRPVIDEIVGGSLLGDTWYRLDARFTKLSATSAMIEASLTELDGDGNPFGLPVLSGTIPDTSDLSGFSGPNESPAASYFGGSTDAGEEGNMWPAYKNFTAAAAPADNACFGIDSIGGGTFVTVPDVVGLAQADAEAEIIASGLLVGSITDAGSDTVSAGDVIN